MEALTASYMSASCGGPYVPFIQPWSFQEGACQVITGSYTLPKQPEVKRKDEGVQKYFEMLGYKVTWDHNYRRGEEWFELYDEDGTLVAQIDTGVELKYIIEDMIAWHQGKEPLDYPEKPDWTCSGEMGEEMKLLFKRVHDCKLYGIMPNGQLTFPL